MKQLKKRFQNFISSKKEYSFFVTLCAGLYPLIHYYNSNYTIADSWKQFLYLVGTCLVLPQIFNLLRQEIKKINFLKFLNPYGLSVLNIVTFLSLIGMLVFLLKKIELLILFTISVPIGFLLKQHLKKIVVLQLILAIMSSITIIPKLLFILKTDTKVWNKITDSELNTTFKTKPNIFLIQPDGYVNFSELYKKPYYYNDKSFEKWLEDYGFNNYKNFKSNYYSTLTSNASLFTMQHHYYVNTNPKTLKTYKASTFIIGDKNNVLQILKNNKYKSHFLTDNSYLIINNTPSKFDFTNVTNTRFHKTGQIANIDIVNDLKNILDTLPKKNNFFFIEKTIPAHIAHKNSYSKGILGEQQLYLNRLQEANSWLKKLITEINNFDNNALIIIAADHGGFVGLNYTMEVVERNITELEKLSSFSALMSVKWPKEIAFDTLNFKSSVNIFRNVFYTLSGNKTFITNKKENSSFLPMQSNGKNYYKAIHQN